MGIRLAGALHFAGDPAEETCRQRQCLGAHLLLETTGEGRSPLLHPHLAGEGPPNGRWQRAAHGCRAAVGHIQPSAEGGDTTRVLVRKSRQTQEEKECGELARGQG